MAGAPFVLVEAGAAGTLLFRNPRRLLTARTLDEVGVVLEQMAAAARAGFHLAGTVAYEAGYAFEPCLRPLAPAAAGPLLCFGVFDAPEAFDWGGVGEGGAVGPLTPAWRFDDYARRFARVIDYVRAGDVYQVNLTFPLHGRWEGDPLALYARLRRHQPAAFGALAALGTDTVLSCSPELFFALERGRIRVRPMKGTAPRGRDDAEDERLARQLAAGVKDRAENLMIVDLMRNDLGRVARLGSVDVTDLFTVERYPTLLQMTSGVTAVLREEVGLPALFAGLFPCGSVTGAPKIRAMEIIRALEDRPRGVYCGAIGHIRPDGDMRFSVAIRTAVLAPDGRLVFDVGSGIVYDSQAAAEYEECLLKARFLDRAMRPA